MDNQASQVIKKYLTLKQCNNLLVRGGINKNLRKIICPKINFEVWKL
jgi:hypothetical protein